MAKSYPWNSTYAFAENRVVDGVDLEGLEFKSIHDEAKYYGVTAMQLEFSRNLITIPKGYPNDGPIQEVNLLDVPVMVTETGIQWVGEKFGMEPEQAGTVAAGVGLVFSTLRGKPKGLGNPFKNKTLKEVEDAMEKHVKSGKLIPTNSAPGNRAYKNTKSKYSYNLDPGVVSKSKKGGKEPAHVDVNYPNPKPKNVPNKKKLPVKEN